MNPNPYAPPNAGVSADSPGVDVEYAGFWLRLAASLIDAVLIVAITYPILYVIYGSAYFDDSKGFIAGFADFAISWFAPAVASVWFWVRKQGTPGKLALSLRIVDAATGKKLSIRQSIGRYCAYFVSMIPFGLGFVWVGIDARKQGWHDKLAKTVVIRSRKPAAG